VSTSAETLREIVVGVRGPVTVVVEESTLTGWLRRELVDLADEFIACDPRYNDLIWRAEDKNDDKDPLRLLTLAVMHRLKKVYHADPERYGLKELVLTYHRITRDVTRYHNRIKAKCRQHGFGRVAASVYQGAGRKELLAQMLWPDSRRALRHLLSTFDALKRQQYRIQMVLRRRAQRVEVLRRFQQLPGLGPIISITVFAIVDTPFRFADKKKLWRYAGLSVRDKSSMGKTLSKGASYEGSRWLKYVVIQAAVEAIQQGDNEFAHHYTQMRQAGTSESNARRTVARKILATLYGMWKSGEPYYPLLTPTSQKA